MGGLFTELGHFAASGETAILLHPPLHSAGVFKRDGEGASAKRQNSE